MMKKIQLPSLTGNLKSFVGRQRKYRDLLQLRKASHQALSFKQDKEARCQNCHASLTGPFCHLCGQKDGSLKNPIWSLIVQVLRDEFSIDGKIFQTLLKLMTIPGGVTRTYMDGRRARFMPPVRLFFVTFILFFLILTLGKIAVLDVSLISEEELAQKLTEESAQNKEPTITRDKDGKILKKVGPIGVTIDDKGRLDQITEEQKKKLEKLEAETGIKLDEEGKKVLDEIKESTSSEQYKIWQRLDFKMFSRIKMDEKHQRLTEEDLSKAINNRQDEEADNGMFVQFRQGLIKALKDPEKLNDVLNDQMKWALIYVVPLFAFILRFFHWRKDQRLMHQLVFSLHYHAFLMLLMTAMIAIVPLFGGDVAGYVFLWGSMGYMLVALVIGEKQGVIRAIFKFIFIWPVYFITVTGFMGYFLYWGLINQ